MAHNFTKITQADTQGKGVVGLADTPGLPMGEMQEKFDELVNDVVVPKFNNLCDELDENVGHAIQSPAITNLKLSPDNTLQVSTDGGETYDETASSGHIIMNGAGASFTQRSRLQFSSNTIVTDDPVGKATFVSIPSGQKGDKGDAATITVGTVTKGENPSVINSGSNTDAIFNFVLPEGEQGPAATIQVGTVTKGDNPSVSNRGTSGAAIFDFVLPKGDRGPQGQGINVLGEYPSLEALEAAHPTGNAGNAYMIGTTNPKDLYVWDVDNAEWANQGALQGAKGDTGDAGTITIGTVTEGNAVAVENVGTSENAILNFTLKKGDKGDTGNAATIAIGTVTKGENPSVTNVGTSTAAVFNMVLPKGDKGDKGDPTSVNGKTGDVTLYPSDLYMVDYEKPDVTSAIVATDSLEEAVGKLEKKADINASGISSLNTDLTNNHYTKTQADSKFATNSDLANNIKIVRNDFRDTSIPSGNFSFLFNVTTQSGYKAVGIVGWSTQNRDVSSEIFISTVSVDISTQTIQFLGKNTLGTAYTLNPYFIVLYVKE